MGFIQCYTQYFVGGGLTFLIKDIVWLIDFVTSQEIFRI
jgi:hypothetical protein